LARTCRSNVQWGRTSVPGLVLLNGFVFIGFSSLVTTGPCRMDTWIRTRRASSKPGIWCTSPNGKGEWNLRRRFRTGCPMRVATAYCRDRKWRFTLGTTASSAPSTKSISATGSCGLQTGSGVPIPRTISPRSKAHMDARMQTWTQAECRWCPIQPARIPTPPPFDSAG